MIFRLLIALGNLFLLFRGCAGTFIQHPQNAVSDVTGTVIFNCTTDAPFITQWTFRKNVYEEETVIADYCTVQYEYRNNFKTVGVNSKCDLIVFNINMSFGGVYTCVDGPAPTYTAIALLTVVNSSSQSIKVHPTAACDRSNTTDVSCSIDYSGSTQPGPTLPPALNLTSESNNIVLYTTEVVSLTKVTRYVTFGTSSPGSVGPFHCVAYFGTPQDLPPPPPYIDNAPENKYSTSMSAITLPIFMKPKNVRISGRHCTGGVCYCEDGTSTVVECFADGCPFPAIHWSATELDSYPLDVRGNALNATFSGTYQCTATNTFNGSSYFSATADAVVSGCHSGTDAAVIAIAVVVSYCGLCILISCIFLIFYGSSEKHRHRLNDTCPRLKDMLPTMNDKGCSPWVIVTVLIAVVASVFCVPALLIATFCCDHQSKSHGGKSNGNKHENEAKQFSNLQTSTTYDNVNVYETVD